MAKRVDFYNCPPWIDAPPLPQKEIIIRAVTGTGIIMLYDVELQIHLLLSLRIRNLQMPSLRVIYHQNDLKCDGVCSRFLTITPRLLPHWIQL
jgi:hypothetical protein